MNVPKLKICGMKHPENILEVTTLKPDYLGFIFYEKSPRNFNGEIPEIASEIKKTGVFVNAELNFIVQMVDKYNFKAIQLHGNESPEYCEKLRRLLIDKIKSQEKRSIEIIKVFSILNSFDFKNLEPYDGLVDFFLFDTKGKNKGGNGTVFNWDILKKNPSNTPFFLSGGIGLEEIEPIKELINYFEKHNKSHLIYALDVNSKFELEAGLKDQKQLKLFKDTLGLKPQL